VLVADAMTGQDAVNVAAGFNEAVQLTGVILTKLEGDARGGAALAIRAVTGVPIYFAGVGERLDALEVFHPDRMASRILGKGDVLSLIEKIERAYDRRKAEELRKKVKKDEFSFEDFREQIRTVRSLGPVGDLLAMVPGMKKLASGLDSEAAERELKKVEAIINSMTIEERHNSSLIGGSRRRRIAKGSGTSVSDVNRLLKQYQQMRKMMKKLGKLGGRGLGRVALPRLFS
jgi:signal recognition particle subunit SRP54